MTTPDLVSQLGKIVAAGMGRVDDADRFVDPAVIRNTYVTHFPMPDGREWELTITRRRK